MYYSGLGSKSCTQIICLLIVFTLAASSLSNIHIVWIVTHDHALYHCVAYNYVTVHLDVLHAYIYVHIYTVPPSFHKYNI